MSTSPFLHGQDPKRTSNFTLREPIWLLPTQGQGRYNREWLNPRGGHGARAQGPGQEKQVGSPCPGGFQAHACGQSAYRFGRTKDPGGRPCQATQGSAAAASSDGRNTSGH